MPDFITLILKQFSAYKLLAERTMAQLSEEQLNWKHVHDGNSIAIIVKHMRGNMRSRFTDFLTTDGEKPWRERDEEFEENSASRQEVMGWWDEGWKIVFDAIEPLGDADLKRIVLIRNEPHTVMDALLRQLAHYSSHVGQIILLGKHLAGDSWKTLSIQKGGSKAFNEQRFGKH